MCAAVKTVDCRGLSCPQPVLKTKEALEQGADLLEVIVDNEASKNNVSRFASSQGCEVEVKESDDGCFRLTLQGGGGAGTGEFDPGDYACPVESRFGLVYVIASDTMGRGSEELGWALLQTYIQTIKNIDPLPSRIIFYNSGVKLVTSESGALEALQELQELGVEILVCGTCLDFYELKAAIKVGTISNMYDIMQSMTSADKVVSPY
ncbi:sulfurtransferase-like selenium metabolism protein YedF [Desulfolithobacter sp.]